MQPRTGAAVPVPSQLGCWPLPAVHPRRLCFTSVTEFEADPPETTRRFSSSESAILRRVRIDEADAAHYPEHFPVSGVVSLIEAGIPAADVGGLSSSLNAAALIAFRDKGHSFSDTDYNERFFDPGLLAEEGVPASAANAYPDRFTELDVARLYTSGATADVTNEFAVAWDSAQIASLVGRGVTAAEADGWRDVVPADSIADCVRAGVEPEAVARFIQIVGETVRTSDDVLVSMALDNDRLDDPEGFRSDLLAVAIRSVDTTDDAVEDKETIVLVLTEIVERGGQISTTIPNSWNRRRVLHIGPADEASAVLSIAPDQPLLFSDGEIDLDAGLRSVKQYCADLTS